MNRIDDVSVIRPNFLEPLNHSKDSVLNFTHSQIQEQLQKTIHPLPKIQDFNLIEQQDNTKQKNHQRRLHIFQKYLDDGQQGRKEIGRSKLNKCRINFRVPVVQDYYIQQKESMGKLRHMQSMVIQMDKEERKDEEANRTLPKIGSMQNSILVVHSGIVKSSISWYLLLGITCIIVGTTLAIVIRG